MKIQIDRELVRAARAGDKVAFGTLLTRYETMVRGIARRMVGHAGIAHDLTQETFLQAFLSLDSLRSDRRFKSWLYGIALNVCRDYLRSQRANVYSLEDISGGGYREPAAYGLTPEEIAERLELRRAVTDAIEGLSPANRDAVLLFYYDGLSLRGAAAVLDISVAAVKGRLHRARRQLHVELLPVYRLEYVERGEINMIPVKIVDVMRQETLKESGETLILTQLILFDEAGRRAIVFWVGETEGLAIAQGLSGFEMMPRPTTQLFLSRLLNAAEATLEYVQISALKNDVLYATVRVNAGGRVQDVDARPSDALGLAVLTDTPIYVSEEVMQQVGQSIPAEHSPTGKGLAGILEYLEGRRQSLEASRIKRADKPVEQHEQSIEQKTRAILEEAFEKPS